MRNFLSDEDGVTMLEYGLLAALIAVVCIASVTTVGSNLTLVFKKVYLNLQKAELTMEISDMG